MNALIELLAVQATTYIEPTSNSGEGWIFDIEKFAALIRADEREACAKVCENEAKEHDRNTYDARDGRYDWQADGANACAAAIRARGNT